MALLALFQEINDGLIFTGQLRGLFTANGSCRWYSLENRAEFLQCRAFIQSYKI